MENSKASGETETQWFNLLLAEAFGHFQAVPGPHSTAFSMLFEVKGQTWGTFGS